MVSVREDACHDDLDPEPSPRLAPACRLARLWRPAPLHRAGSLAPLILLLGFVLHIVQDKMLAEPAGLPAWYLPLRWRLTVVACICLLANAWQTWA